MDIWPQEDTPQYTYSEAFRNTARERDAALKEAREWREIVEKLHAMFVVMTELRSQMSDRIILGIDPGAGGALAWVSGDGNLIEVADMPVIEVRGKRRICAPSLAQLFDKRAVSLVAIEGVGSMPGQGVASSFAFGYSAGILEGMAAGFGLPVQITRAAEWKRKAGVPADKGAARQMASRLWPGAAAQFARAKDDGRAESALLARWAASV